MLNKKVLYLPKENKSTAIKFERHLSQNIAIVVKEKYYAVKSLNKSFLICFCYLSFVKSGKGLTRI